MRRRLATRFPAAFSIFFGLLASSALAETVGSLGDAKIERDVRSGSWTVYAGGASMTLTIDPSKDYAVTSMISPSGTDWMRVHAADAVITADGTRHTFGSRSSGFSYTSVAIRDDGRHLELVVTFTLLPQNLNVTRHIAVVPGSPTFETWTSFEALGNSVMLSHIDGFRAVVAPGTLHWVSGLLPASDDVNLNSVFARRRQTLAPGDTLSLGSTERSSQHTVPWLAVTGDGDVLYAGLMWSGGWSSTTTRTTDGLAMDWRLADMTTVVGATPVEGPHAIVGLARGSLPEATAALGSYIVQGLRGGRPLTPLVTYNTWFAYGTRVDDTSMRSEMARAASMGVELFVIDAGWYAGADTKDPTNFTAGLGSWKADPDRFPNGLKALTDYAHGLGLKFGVWVEPERVALSQVGENGLDQAWLATAGGSYRFQDSAQICLAGKAGRQWVVDRLAALIDSVQPDYLKWDNNRWLNCDRQGHGHLPSDGNFAHVTALYQILDMLRQKYPALTIENCSSGGNRLDLGMLRYTDVAWMDDHTAPSVKVRHNIEGLSLIFPPTYLLSFVVNLGWEPLHNSPDLSNYVRSRMVGVLGLCYRSEWLSSPDLDAITREITLYKRLRPTSVTTAALLTPQAAVGDVSPGWDVLQQTALDGSVLVYAFAGQTGVHDTIVFPVGLEPDAVYRVISVDEGSLGEFTGADLMQEGLRIFQSSDTAAHVLSLMPQP